MSSARKARGSAVARSSSVAIASGRRGPPTDASADVLIDIPVIPDGGADALLPAKATDDVEPTLVAFPAAAGVAEPGRGSVMT